MVRQQRFTSQQVSKGTKEMVSKEMTFIMWNPRGK